MSSGLVCTAAGVRIPFSSKAEYYSIVGIMDLVFFIHSFVSGDLGCFHVLAIVRNAAGGMGVQIISLGTLLQFFGVHPQKENGWVM